METLILPTELKCAMMCFATLSGENDFMRCQLPPSWNTCVDRLGDGKKIVFPVMARPVLHWGPKSYEKKQQNGQLEMLPHYRETVQLCFTTSAHTLN
jgi:hypothetical protein